MSAPPNDPEQFDFESMRMVIALKQFENRFTSEIESMLPADKLRRLRDLAPKPSLEPKEPVTFGMTWIELQPEVIREIQKICQREKLRIPESLINSLTTNIILHILYPQLGSI